MENNFEGCVIYIYILLLEKSKKIYRKIYNIINLGHKNIKKEVTTNDVSISIYNTSELRTMLVALHVKK